jgi:AraC-like DNA-binding protein/ligand-binding sensor protein
MRKNGTVDFVQRLRQSRIYQDYEAAFVKATKLPLEVFSVGRECEGDGTRCRSANPFCAILAQKGKICSACPDAQRKLTSPDLSDTQTVRCFAGLTVTNVPVKLEGRVIAFLQTGRVFLQEPNAERFQKMTTQLTKWGVRVNFARLKNAYFHSSIVKPSQYSAIVRLLEIFAEHLAFIADQLTVPKWQGDSLMVRRAKDYIAMHQSNPIKLEEVARAANVSKFHFCRGFKQATGLTFGEYVCRTRIERAKILLHDNSLRVSEIAYDTGFQTITHFNRMFRKLVGCSPKEFRSGLAKIN